MHKSKRIIFVIYPGSQLLDMAGPSSVFAGANEALGHQIYDVVVASSTGGLIQTSCGASLASVKLDQIKTRKTDTVLVTGAEESALIPALRNRTLKAWLSTAKPPKVERMGSVCTGAVLLASYGLLNGRSASTHWAAKDKLANQFPNVKISTDALYTIDGAYWTSAGASTGIDLALAMIRVDQSAELMLTVAKRLVVYAHRPGHQSQFSAVLNAQSKGRETFSALIDWVEKNLHRDIKAEDLAERSGLSGRTFYRRFMAEVEMSPRVFVETLRLERARFFLESGLESKVICRRIGYRTEQAFRVAFIAQFGVSPTHYKKMNSQP
jgi:transcriptional regulator GlxA family with amidase domain